MAAILPVVESCRLLKTSVRDYLAAILPGLADVAIYGYQRLLPLRGSSSIRRLKRPAYWSEGDFLTAICDYIRDQWWVTTFSDLSKSPATFQTFSPVQRMIRHPSFA